MKRHGDRKAHFERRQKLSLQWSGKVGDRDRAAAAADADAAAAAAASDNVASPGGRNSSGTGTPATQGEG